MCAWQDIHAFAYLYKTSPECKDQIVELDIGPLPVKCHESCNVDSTMDTSVPQHQASLADVVTFIPYYQLSSNLID